MSCKRICKRAFGKTKSLIANGVTVQEWIPVTERLPEDDLPNGTNRRMIRCLVYTDKKTVKPCVRQRYINRKVNGEWMLSPWEWNKDVFAKPTHWMPPARTADGGYFMIFENEAVRNRFATAFPKFFINHNLEVIVHPRRNTYFLLTDVHTETDLIAKILEWLSREAAKSVYNQSQKYHLDGINAFLGTSFSQEDMMLIYTYLGNRCNHKKTIRFIESGYDLGVLEEPPKGE